VHPPDDEDEDDLDHEHVPYTTNSKEQIQAFLTRDHRNTFITRVYSILSTQLLFTAAVVLAFGTNRNLQYWIFKKGQMGMNKYFTLFSWKKMDLKYISFNQCPCSLLFFHLLRGSLLAIIPQLDDHLR
jgi:FtsH-binding integral membrane protein